MEVRIEIGKCRNFKMEKKNGAKQDETETPEIFICSVALGMTFLLNLSGCSRRFTNYPETAGTVAIVDSTEREAVRDENGENPDQPIDLDNLGEQQSAAEMEALAAAEAAERELVPQSFAHKILKSLPGPDLWR